MTTTIYVNFNLTRIFAATADSVILMGRDAPGSNGGYPCVLHVSRGTYFAAMERWLDRKAELSGWTGFGYHVVFEAELTGSASVAASLLGGDDYTGDKVDIPSYTAPAAFEIEMEHG